MIDVRSGKTVPGGASSEFKRGGRVLFAAFVGVSVSMVSLLYYSSGVFIVPLETEFGWTRAQLGGAGFLSVAVLAVCAPLVGKLTDRYGLRAVSAFSLLAYAACLFALSKMSGALSAYYAIVVAYTVLGLGSSPIAFTRAVNAWFSDHRGLALGISMAGTGIAGVILPLVLTPFVAEHGWRAGYMVLAMTVVAATPIVWLWIRDTPPPSAPARREESAPEDLQAVSPGADFRAARRNPVFWIMGAMFFLIALSVSGLIMFFIPILLDAGLSPEVAGALGALLGASVVAGRLLTGFLIDRIFAPRVAAVLFSLVAMGCLALALGGISFAVIAAIALGLAMGTETDLIGYLVFRYFGLGSYSQIYGAQYGIFAIGAGVSPLAAGYIYDITGVYDHALIGGAILLCAAVTLSFLLPAFPGPSNSSSKQEVRL